MVVKYTLPAATEPIECNELQQLGEKAEADYLAAHRINLYEIKNFEKKR